VLDSPVQYTKNVRPICIPSGHDTYAGQDATVSGWGLLKADGPRVNHNFQTERNRSLNFAHLLIYSQEPCKRLRSKSGLKKNVVTHMWMVLPQQASQTTCYVLDPRVATPAVYVGSNIFPQLKCIKA